MTKIAHRAFALTFALLFLVTSAAFSIAVIVQLVNQSHQNNSSNTSQTAASQNSQNKLQGTKLKGFTPVSKIDSLKISDTKVGAGLAAKAGDTVTVAYTGAVAATGVIFQSSSDTGQPATVTLKNGTGGVISGWAQGVPGMKVGGTRRLLIPAAMAYGANPPPNSSIPANAALVFDIILLKIGK
jgi:FKBP-type peptidyl-prolyl cis-trans isomerase